MRRKAPVMQIKKERDKTFTITNISFGMLLALQHALQVVKEDRRGAYTALKEEAHECINQTIEVASGVDDWVNTLKRIK